MKDKAVAPFGHRAARYLKYATIALFLQEKNGKKVLSVFSYYCGKKDRLQDKKRGEALFIFSPVGALL